MGNGCSLGSGGLKMLARDEYIRRRVYPEVAGLVLMVLCAW